MCSYQVADKLPKGEFERLICCVIDFDNRITILFSQYLAYKPFKSRCVGRNLLELVITVKLLLDFLLDTIQLFF